MEARIPKRPWMIMALLLTLMPTFSTIGGGGIIQGHLAPITFERVVFQNTTIQGDTNTFLTTPSWNTNINESMIVVASTQSTFSTGPPLHVVSVTDTLGSSFSKIISRAITGAVEPTEIEVWFSQVKTSFAANAVTVTWNGTNENSNMIQVVLYQNIASIGVTASQFSQTCTGTTCTPLPLTTSKSGSWVLAATATGAIPLDPVTSPCPGGVSAESSGFVSRSKGCSVPGITDGVETWVSDNATSLRNGLTVNYHPTITTTELLSGTAQVSVELIPTDLEPQIDARSFCLTAGDTCHVNMAVRASGGINTLQTVANGVQYCTGITTLGLTTTASSNVIATMTYSALDTNFTLIPGTSGAKLLIQIYRTTTAPSTTFGSGLCDSGGVVHPGGLSTITFVNTGTNGQYNINYYSASATGITPALAAGTYYFFIEITVQLVGAGHMSMAQWGASPNSQLFAWQSA